MTAGRRGRSGWSSAAGLCLALLAAASCRKSRGAVETEHIEPPRVSAEPAPTPSASAAEPNGALREITFDYGDTPMGTSTVVVAVPAAATKASPLPVLVALHGRGESLKDPARGARGWLDDYDMKAATARLAAPPLTTKDFGGFVTADRLARFNQELAADGYRGLIVVCPYLPDAFHGDQAFDDGSRYAHFVVDEVLPRVYRETPAIGTPATTAIDGVSLGGRAALLVGLLRPAAFGVVAALQPAIDSAEARPFASLAARARTTNPALVLRLLTSSEDYFLEPTLELSKALDAQGVKHRTDLVVGPHSYEFNRGPGVYEMLLFHDRAQRGLGGI